MHRVRAVRKEVKRPSSQSSRATSAGSSKVNSRIGSRAPSPERNDYEYDEGLDSDDSDTSSRFDGDEETGGNGRRFRDDAWEDAFDQAVDDLSEKRLSIREKALNQLIDVLAHHYIVDKLDRCKETVIDSLKRCVKREKSAHENALGMRALSLCFITLGPGQDALFQDLCFSLKYIITHTGSAELREAGAIALAVSCFVGSEDAGDTFDLLNFYSQQLVSPSNTAANQPNAQRAILNAFGLLLTCVDDMGYAKQIFTNTIAVHIRLLESPHTEVRMASGENIALMYELLSKNGVSTSGLDERRDAILLALYDLTNESSKRQSKKKRSVQKTVVRDVLHTIEDGEAPELKLKFHGKIFTFKSWNQLRRLQIFREVLGEGLHVHFKENDMLQDIFDFGAGAQLGHAMEQLELRQVNSPTSEISKERSRILKKGRDQRLTVLGANGSSAYADDGDSS
ncbi:interferon-related developmental regulator-domain-containing protein [Syncephalis fuscata]|nr:interferon-related developmental regulator-domain-containing protein [Syncephalis fuscata]